MSFCCFCCFFFKNSSQNRVVDFEASVLDHPDAECIFFNRLYNLDLNTLLPGAEIMGGNPCKLEKYVFNFVDIC